MLQPTELREQITANGFAICSNILDRQTVHRFGKLIDSCRQQENAENVSNSGGTYGLRNLTDVVPEVRELVQHAKVVELVESVIGSGAFMVRATLFDKTVDANWGVFWHQDLSIAVTQRCEVEGYNAWTRKAGVHCVQPPTDLMRKILTVRLHLDDSRTNNGSLKVLPGTHRLTKLSTAEVEAQQQKTEEVACEVDAGGAILMCPLLLHASSPMDEPTSRRVIHLEFAAFELPAPLQWRYRIPCRPTDKSITQT